MISCYRQVGSKNGRVNENEETTSPEYLRTEFLDGVLADVYKKPKPMPHGADAYLWIDAHTENALKITYPEWLSETHFTDYSPYVDHDVFQLPARIPCAGRGGRPRP